MPEYVLIGFPLSHSFSATYFTEKFKTLGLTDFSYSNFELRCLKLLDEIFNTHPHLSGFNVTIPYKQEILQYVNELDNTAASIGAVNTVKISMQNGVRYLKGFNTDVIGFEKSLLPLIDGRTKALVLGTGGASKAVEFVLLKLNISCQMVSREQSHKAIAYADLNKAIIEQHQLIINTTPLGSFPSVEVAPSIPYQFINSSHLCYDLIYNPSLTSFLKKAKQQGAVIKNGLEMLQLQAEAAFQIWMDDKL